MLFTPSRLNFSAGCTGRRTLQYAVSIPSASKNHYTSVVHAGRQVCHCTEVQINPEAIVKCLPAAFLLFSGKSATLNSVQIISAGKLTGAHVFTRIVQYIERQAGLHRLLLALWRRFPPRLAGFLKGLLTRSWVLGAVAVMVDDTVTPARVLLVEHSYRRRGAWGLPGGSMDSIPGDPTMAHSEVSPDDVLEATLSREVREELGIEVVDIQLLRVDAVPYVEEEPGPYRLTFYFLCRPAAGFAAIHDELASGKLAACSPEITRVHMVSLDGLDGYDLFSTDARFLQQDLPRLLPAFRSM